MKSSTWNLAQKIPVSWALFSSSPGREASSPARRLAGDINARNVPNQCSRRKSTRKLLWPRWIRQLPIGDSLLARLATLTIGPPTM